MTDESMRQEWVHCPVCGNKTRLRLREDTVLTHFPLFCPKCKKESLIDAKKYRIQAVCLILKQPEMDIMKTALEELKQI